MEEDEKQKLLKISEIAVHLDAYDDIFSDFDPRPYSVRALSDDFLAEMQKACKVKPSGNLEIKFIIPKKMENGEHESLIKRRLKEFFKKHHELKHKEIKKAQRKAVKFIVAGAIISMVGTYIALLDSATQSSKIWNFLIKLLLVLLEPAGWFFIWDGLSRFVSIREDSKDELDFYEKMLNSEYHFTTH